MVDAFPWDTLWISDLSFGHQMGEHLLLGGFQYQRERVEDRILAYNRAFDDTFTNAGIYIQDQFRASHRVTLVGGVRRDKTTEVEHIKHDKRKPATPRLRVGAPAGSRLEAYRKPA